MDRLGGRRLGCFWEVGWPCRSARNNGGEKKRKKAQTACQGLTEVNDRQARRELHFDLAHAPLALERAGHSRGARGAGHSHHRQSQRLGAALDGLVAVREQGRAWSALAADAAGVGVGRWLFFKTENRVAQHEADNDAEEELGLVGHGDKHQEVAESYLKRVQKNGRSHLGPLPRLGPPLVSLAPYFAEQPENQIKLIMNT